MKAVDYSTTVVYKIVCNDSDVTDVYVGVTVDIKVRSKTHRRLCCDVVGKDPRSLCKVYKFIRANGGYENWSIIILETCECKDFMEASLKEQFYMDSLNSTLNTHRRLKYGKFVTKNDRKEYDKVYRRARYLRDKELKKTYSIK